MKGLPDNLHPRRPARLPGFDYSAPGAYSVTVCTQGKVCMFGEVVNSKMQLSGAGRIVQEVWGQLPQRYPNVELDSFVVMPNHVHGIIRITVGAIHELPLRDSPPRELPVYELPLREKPETPLNVKRRNMLLPKVMGFFKMNSAKLINRMQQTPGSPVWQRGYYEHVVRCMDRINRIREYILDNPLRWEMDRENQERNPAGI